MKITYKGDYALKALLHLAIHYNEGEVLSINEIAKFGDIPVKFLEQILLMLKKGGFVKSKRGMQGGFILAKNPKDITVGEVIRFVDGPLEPISCVENEHYKGCKDTAGCIFRPVWIDVKNAISIAVDTLTFEELVFRHKAKNIKMGVQYEYSI